MRGKTEKMRLLFITGYWVAAILATALLLSSLQYEFWQGLMLGMVFLLCAMALSYLLPETRKEPKWQRTRSSIYIIL